MILRIKSGMVRYWIQPLCHPTVKESFLFAQKCIYQKTLSELLERVPICRRAVMIRVLAPLDDLGATVTDTGLAKLISFRTTVVRSATRYTSVFLKDYWERL